jgi:hypothetical protein
MKIIHFKVIYQIKMKVLLINDILVIKVILH